MSVEASVQLGRSGQRQDGKVAVAWGGIYGDVELQVWCHGRERDDPVSIVLTFSDALKLCENILNLTGRVLTENYDIKKSEE